MVESLSEPRSELQTDLDPTSPLAAEPAASEAAVAAAVEVGAAVVAARGLS